MSDFDEMLVEGEEERSKECDRTRIALPIDRVVEPRRQRIAVLVAVECQICVRRNDSRRARTSIAEEELAIAESEHGERPRIVAALHQIERSGV